MSMTLSHGTNPALGMPMAGLLRLDGRVVLVTGAGSGLGRVIALRCAEAGAQVVLSARRKETLEATAALFADPEQAIIMPVDLLDDDQASALPDKVVNATGQLDVIINNAGAGSVFSIAEMSLAYWDETQRLNLRAPFILSQAAGRHFRKRERGAIVNISSIAGISGVHNAAAYSVAKAGLQMLTRTIAAEWGRYGVRANAIAPGYVETEASIRVAQEVGTELFDQMAKAVPLRRNAVPDDVARLAVFLASDASDFVSGQIIAVDGGPVIPGDDFEVA